MAALEYETTLVDILDPAAAAMTPAEVARGAAALERVPDEGLTFSAPGVRAVSLSPAVTRMVASILREVAQGHTVALVTTAEEVSTGVAARLLGVSRPHVAMLVDTGVLPGRRINKHRRVRLADVVALKREMDQQRALVREMAELGQEMGLYDDPGMRMPPR